MDSYNFTILQNSKFYMVTDNSMFTLLHKKVNIAQQKCENTGIHILHIFEIYNGFSYVDVGQHWVLWYAHMQIISLPIQ